MTVVDFWVNFIIIWQTGKRKKDEQHVFDSIRKPTAPPSQTFGKAKPEPKSNPSLRKIKHKKKDTVED